jgi:hypothetical protein
MFVIAMTVRHDLGLSASPGLWHNVEVGDGREFRSSFSFRNPRPSLSLRSAERLTT